MADTTNTDITAASGAAYTERAHVLQLLYAAAAHEGPGETLGAITAAIQHLQAAPAAQEAEPAAAPGFPPRILALLCEVASRNPPPGRDVWEDDRGEPLQDDADAALAWIAARPQADAGAPAVPEGWTDGLRAIDSFAAHIRRTLDSADYTGKTVPGLKDGPLYGACERAIFIQNKVRDLIAAAPQAPAAPTIAGGRALCKPQIAEAGEILGAPHADWPEWCRSFAERQAYQCGVADARAIAPAAGAAPSQHITQPYTVAEIRERVASGDYSAELMLQHAMLHLGAVAGAAPTDAEIGQLFADETGFLMEQQPAAIADFARAVLARWGAAAPAQATAPTDAMVDAYLLAQRRAVEEADRFGRPSIGALHTKTVWEACRAGLAAALGAAVTAQEAEDAARYRWLRDVSVPPHNFYLSVPDEFKDERYTKAEVDAAIDAARARQEGGS